MVTESRFRPRVVRTRIARGDLIAGITVAVLLIPQALAYAEIAGLPAFHGLYAAALPTIAAAFFASSRYLQTGPVAMTALLTFGALSVLAEPGSDDYIGLAILLALMVGIARLGLGLLKGGVIAYLMSQPVLMGFTSAAAILIIASQLPTIVGVSASGSRILVRAWDAIVSVGDWHWPSILFAGAAAAIIVLARRLGPRVPGVVIAVVGALVVSAVTDFTGATLDAIPDGFPPFTLSFPWAQLPSLVVPALVIALLGFAEPVAIARNFAAQDREPWDPNREFVSQGVANIASAVSSGFPVGGSFSRSSVARLSGGQTRWTGGIAGLVVLAFLPFASVLEPLPKAVLAATVVVAVVRLVRVVPMIRLIKVTWGQAFVAWVTFLATLLLAPRIDIGVIIGVGAATLIHLRREALIRIDAHIEDAALVLRPYGVLYFGSAPRLGEALMEHLALHPHILEVVVDLESLGRIDYTGAVALKSFFDECEAAGLDAELHNVPPQARGTINRYWGDDLVKIMHPQ